MIDDNIKAKIRKLFALANDKAATEDEAATAMRFAMGLMAKHGIAESELGGEAPKTKKGAPVKFKFGKHQVMIATAAGHLFGCRVVMRSMGKNGIYFAGRPDNIEMAEATMFFIMQQVERLYKQHLRSGMTQKERGEFRKTFKQACAYRVQQRALDLVDEMQRNDAVAKGATGKNALVVKGYFDQMFAEADAEISGVKKVKQHDIKMGSGTVQGLAAGDQVKLRQEVSHG